MPITFYKPTSAYNAGAIKITTGETLSGNLMFRPDQKAKYFNPDTATPVLSSPRLSSAELLYSFTANISTCNIEPFIDSYTIGLSSTSSSELTSIDINPSTRVFINNKTGVIRLSSMTPGNYKFNYYAKTVDSKPWAQVTLSASIPVTVLSSTMVQTLSPVWRLPDDIIIPPFDQIDDKIIPEYSYTYQLAFRIEFPTEMDEIIAAYKNTTSQFAVVMERGYDESSYTWKYVIDNTSDL